MVAEEDEEAMGGVLGAPKVKPAAGACAAPKTNRPLDGETEKLKSAVFVGAGADAGAVDNEGKTPG